MYLTNTVSVCEALCKLGLVRKYADVSTYIVVWMCWIHRLHKVIIVLSNF